MKTSLPREAKKGGQKLPGCNNDGEGGHERDESRVRGEGGGVILGEDPALGEESLGRKKG